MIAAPPCRESIGLSLDSQQCQKKTGGLMHRPPNIAGEEEKSAPPASPRYSAGDAAAESLSYGLNVLAVPCSETEAPFWLALAKGAKTAATARVSAMMMFFMVRLPYV